MWTEELSPSQCVKKAVVWVGGTVLGYFLVSWLVDALNERSPFLVKVLLMFLIGAIIYGSNENLNLKRRVDELNKLNGRNSSGS
ncbi:F0F1-type ATP synthase assembly protein I [Paraburkholderia fungorum]|jgi:hypothetical protein|uniref:hypothetical protein n=1 Tax=Paraburkholderia fungorum TaxID=134537 RepID=UPI001610D83A|nr:hypothetical protein [Paraburkholderia fungorum]MBB4518159.1 F0F1-type ATP synthase assembly protein I [Paraburkholderia fungorum]